MKDSGEVALCKEQDQRVKGVKTHSIDGREGRPGGRRSGWLGSEAGMWRDHEGEGRRRASCREIPRRAREKGR